MSRYPLYPQLSEEGHLEAQRIIDIFKERLKKLCEETLGNLYTDVLFHIESDSWHNFRDAIVSGLRDYGNRKFQAEYDFKQIREKIYAEFRADIIKDLDQDNLEKIKNLEDEVKRLREMLHDEYRSYR